MYIYDIMDHGLAAGIVLTIVVVAMSVVMILYGSYLTNENIGPMSSLAAPKTVLITMGSIGLAACLGFWIYAGVTNSNDFGKAFMINSGESSPFSTESYLQKSLQDYNSPIMPIMGQE